MNKNGGEHFVPGMELCAEEGGDNDGCQVKEKSGERCLVVSYFVPFFSYLWRVQHCFLLCRPLKSQSLTRIYRAGDNDNIEKGEDLNDQGLHSLEKISHVGWDYSSCSFFLLLHFFFSPLLTHFANVITLLFHNTIPLLTFDIRLSFTLPSLFITILHQESATP